jgi:CDP-diglyceride synthetase
MPTARPEALDALIAASLQSRRDKLVRAARNQRIRTRFAYGCSGSIVLLTLAAIFLAHDSEAAAFLAVFACITSSFAYFAGKATQKKLADSLRQIDQSGK